MGEDTCKMVLMDAITLFAIKIDELIAITLFAIGTNLGIFFIYLIDTISL